MLRSRSRSSAKTSDLISVLPALFTTKSTGHRGLHQTPPELRSAREETLCTVRGFVSGGRNAAIRVCNISRFDERQLRLRNCCVWYACSWREAKR